ncbi:MAG: glycosyltransferase [Prevotellaceae bacterium]|nr:glycosyltransferase [Prevotellaceae bacterium]
MNKIKVSVIVPIYNVESYVEKCVRSLMEQTMKDGIEFVFVNDATPDNSMAIVQNVVNEYPERKHQIKIIHNTENIGITQTRARGIEMATGEYIGWVDSDDWVDRCMFEKMIKATNMGKIDVVVCNYIECRPERTTEIRFIKSETPLKSIEGILSGKQTFSGTLWNQIFRRDLFLNHMNDIIPTNYSEDTYMIWHIYAHAHSIVYIDEVLYHYNKLNDESLMHSRSFSISSWNEQKENLLKIQHCEYSDSPEYRRALHFFMFFRKWEYKNCFNTPKELFMTFRNASKDIFFFPCITNGNKLKSFLINNFYPLFLLYYNKYK